LSGSAEQPSALPHSEVRNSANDTQHNHKKLSIMGQDAERHVVIVMLSVVMLSVLDPLQYKIGEYKFLKNV